LLVAAFCSGWAIYGTYRDEMKPGLLAAYPALARLFETKEHLAAIATAFAASGALALRLAPSSQAVREAARVALMAAVGTALVAGIAGILVAPAGGPALWRR
jgi:predicted permease